MLTFIAGFVWYWLPDLIFPALSYFTWICWIAPNNVVVNQVFGMKSGIGLLPFTLDCKACCLTFNRFLPFRALIICHRESNILHRLTSHRPDLGHLQHTGLCRLLDLGRDTGHVLLQHLVVSISPLTKQFHL